MDNLKIFVRYLPGASGHFMSLLLLSLAKDIHVKAHHSGHLNLDDINTGHNFSNQWTDEFKQHTTFDINLDQSVLWIQKNFNFYDVNYPYYVVHTHVVNPAPLLLAFENTKLINIISNDANLDQLAYNWVTKSCFLQNQWDILNQGLKFINQKYNKLNQISHVNKHTDLKLLTYINKFQIMRLQDKFNEVSISNNNVFNIKFDDIISGQLKFQLDDIIKFIGINPMPTRKTCALELIDRYAKAQTTVPWIQELNEYN